EIERLVIPIRVPAEVPTPQQCGGTGAEHIRKLHGARIGGAWCSANDLPLAPGVAALVEPEVDPLGIDIHKVRAAGAIQVREEQPFGVEIEVQPRRIRHCHALAEAAVAQIGPVVDCAVMHEHMSLKPSPVMSARRTRLEGSSKNTSGNWSRSWT